MGYADRNSTDIIETADKAMLAASIATVYVCTGELHLACKKLYVAGAYLDAAQDALRRSPSPSDRERWYVDGTRRHIEESIADYAEAVGHSVPPIECFMESR